MLAGPPVTVGMPVCNGEDYLEQALDSLLAQDYTDFELLISDNGSTDATQEICRRYARVDGRIRYDRSEMNRGAAWNYNRLVAMAGGEFFRWAAHDDVLAPSNIRRCIEAFRAGPADAILCYPRAMLIDAAGDTLGEHDDNLDLPMQRPHDRLRHVLENLKKLNPIFGLIRLDALKRTHLCGNYSGADSVLLAELGMLGLFIEIPECLFYRRFHPAMSSVITTLEERSVWFDPANRGRLRNALFATTLLVKMLHAVSTAPIGGVEKVACGSVVAQHWLTCRWKTMLGDVLRAAGLRRL